MTISAETMARSGHELLIVHLQLLGFFSGLFDLCFGGRVGLVVRGQGLSFGRAQSLSIASAFLAAMATAKGLDDL